MLDCNGEQLRIAAAIVTAQWDFETGGGGSCWNHNPKNVRCRKGHEHQPFFLNPGKVNEWEDGELVYAQGPDDPMRIFAAFDDFASGIEEALDLIRDLYKPAWAYLQEAPDGLEGLKRYGRILGDGSCGRRFYTVPKGREEAGIANYCAGLASRYPACRKAAWGE
jgi:hypothetical protein